MTYVIMITESRGREQRVCEKVSRRLEFLMAYMIINTNHTYSQFASGAIALS